MVLPLQWLFSSCKAVHGAVCGEDSKLAKFPCSAILLTQSLNPTPMNYTCTHCGRALTMSPEPDGGDWIIRCLACGARNVIVPIFKLVGWR